MAELVDYCHRMWFDDLVDDQHDRLIVRPSIEFPARFFVVFPAIGGLLALTPLWWLGLSLWWAIGVAAISLAAIGLSMLRMHRATRRGKFDLVIDSRSRQLRLFDSMNRKRRCVPFDAVVAIVDRHYANGRVQDLEFSCHSGADSDSPILDAEDRGLTFRKLWEGRPVGARVAEMLKVPIMYDHRDD